jgi:hypothetical protein
VTQQARNLMRQLEDEDARPRFLIRDRDSTCTRQFDEVFCSEAVRVIKAPVRAPKARAHAERWVGTVRRECLDRLLIVGRRQLEPVPPVSTIHYHEPRPQRALDQLSPLNQLPPSEDATADLIDLDRLRRRELLAALTHEYRLAAQPRINTASTAPDIRSGRTRYPHTRGRRSRQPRAGSHYADLSAPSAPPMLDQSTTGFQFPAPTPFLTTLDGAPGSLGHVAEEGGRSQTRELCRRGPVGRTRHRPRSQ